jgi:DNA recombination protein RmuC
MNESMRQQTDNLTRALRGDVKAQGNWGEVMLERILEESGLRRDDDYTIQGMEMGLLAEDGSRQQPDVIVHLPDNKHIIVDAKVSLVAYERYCSAADDTQRELHCKDFLKSVKAHINGLEQKKYQHNEKLQTPDFVLMFMPVEGAYSFAVQQDRELHSYAWGKKIVLVCPATLFATLRTIASLWNIERQNRNTQEIARQGGALYDKFVDFVADMENINRHMSKASEVYDSAINKLKTGKGNLIGRAEKLRMLDIKTSKLLPKALIDEQDDYLLELPVAAEG